MKTAILRGLPLIVLLTLTAACSKGAKPHTLTDISQLETTTDPHWIFAKPKSQGINPRGLDRLLTAIDEDNLAINSITVVRNGVIVMDAYGTNWKYDRLVSPEDLHEVHSVTKSITSVLISMAQEEGLIPPLSSPALTWFDPVTVNSSADKESITLEDLLTMRSGLSWTEGPGSYSLLGTRNSADRIFSEPMSEKPGTRWNYSTGNSQILGEIFRRATGKTLEEYAAEKLFSPLGISKWQWEADASGTTTGGYGLRLTPRDMAKFGQLCLLGGSWEGRRIIPEDRLMDMTKARTGTPWAGGDYACHWWCPSFGGYAARGYQGQAIYVLPELGLVVVFTSQLDPNTADATLDDLMREYLLPAVKP